MPFVKGASGNPSGRPKGLERRVRELLRGDIDALTLAMRDIALGYRIAVNADGRPEMDADGRPRIELAEGPGGTKITTRDRIEAYKVLTDRGWGKARQVVDLVDDGSSNRVRIDYTLLSDDELDALIKAEEIAEAAGLAQLVDGDEDAASDDHPSPAG